MECRDESPSSISCGYVVDVIFPRGGAACQLRGLDGVLALKKFYKLVFSLEERARERGNEWRSVMESADRLLEHLGYTRNARDLTGAPEPLVVHALEAAVDDPECASANTASKKG